MKANGIFPARNSMKILNAMQQTLRNPSTKSQIMSHRTQTCEQNLLQLVTDKQNTNSPDSMSH